MTVRFDESAPQVDVLHRLTNESDRVHEVAAWAITAFAVGGVARLPQPTEAIDSQEQLPNRKLVLWPYSSLTDARLELGDGAIRIHGIPGEGWFKIGYFNRLGAMSYDRGGVRFTKRFDVDADAEYPDEGCNAEAFVCDDFLELETLSPTTPLAPGASIENVEKWSLEIVD